MRRLALLLAAAALSLPAAASAANVTLQGTVYADGSALAGAQVTAIDPNTGNGVATSTSDGAGHYSLSVAPGTYNLDVLPPASSPVAEELIHGIVVSDNLSYDVILSSNSVAAGLHGVARGLGGAGIPGAYIYLYTQNWNWVGGTYTDATGAFSFSVGNGTYILGCQGGSGGGVAPASWNAYIYNVAVSGSTSLNLALPVVRVSGVVTGSADGAPVANAAVHAHTQTWSNGWFYSDSDATTAADGSYALLSFNGNTDFAVRPPAGTIYSQLNQTRQVSGDSVESFVLQQPSMLTGSVLGYGGVPVPHAYVTIYTSGWQYVTQLQADELGHYKVPLSDGSYIGIFQSGESTPSLTPPSWYCYDYSLQVKGATPFDYNLGAHRITGRVADENQNPAPGTHFNLHGQSYNQGWCYSDGDVPVADDGSYSFIELGNEVNVAMFPPASTTFGIQVKELNPSADMNVDWLLGQASPYAGRVVGWRGQPLANVQLTLYAGSWHSIGWTMSDSLGRFSFPVADGDYFMYFYAGNTANAPQSLSCYHWGISVTAALTAQGNAYDQRLPVVALHESFTDSNGAPVAGVNASDSGFAYLDSSKYFNGYCYTNFNGVSDAAGSYSGFALTGNNNFQFTPPPASGFQPVSVNGAQLSGDLTQAIVLHRPDTTPPTIVTGPTVVHLSSSSVSIRWTTNKASTSIVQYGLTAQLTDSLTDNSYVTDHRVTLTGLQNATPYVFRAGSVDKAKNGPTWSADGTFTSQAPPGWTTPPRITAGPSVPFIDVGNVLVQWTTDEPATTVVSWGTTAGGVLDHSSSSALGAFTTDHSVTIGSLAPNTAYSFQVSSTDPDGNGPTLSRMLGFTTAALPDTHPPRVTVQPQAVAATNNSITVSWTTDKPADSGISFNDGSAYDLVSDSAFVTAHQLTITGLKASTTYSITVSSKDPKGNGPTLAGPIQATTAAAPDLTLPALLVQPAASHVGMVTATIAWTTDKATTSVVHYGLLSGNPSNVSADLTLTSSHSVLITGLVANTTYYFTTDSTDAGGLTTTSNEASFTTRKDTPAATCVGTAAAPATVYGNPDVCGTTLDDTNAGSCESGTCTFDGKASETVAPGSYQVTVTATGPTGSSESCTSYITVGDDAPPRVSCPADKVVECAGAMTYYQPSATCTDNCSCDSSCAGGNFNLGGPWDVSCGAKDKAGNTDSCTAHVTVKDTVPPAVACGPTVVAECDGADGAQATPAPAVATDACGVASLTTYGKSRYGIGKHALSFTAVDLGGNITKASCDDAVEVVDTTPPEVHCPPDATVECNAAAGSVSGFIASAYDLCSPPLPSIDKSGTYPFAAPSLTTPVTFTATDAHGLTNSCTAKVTVKDTIPPVVACGAKVVAECDGVDGATVTPSPATASDACGLQSLTAFPQARYAYGAHDLSFSAVDLGGNSATASCPAAVTVVDTTPPAIHCPAPVTVVCRKNSGQVSGFFATATDVCSPPIPNVDKSGSYPFAAPSLTTQVSFSATDAHGLSSACSSAVTVVDTTKPSISATASPAVLWPPNKALVPINLGLAASDACDPAPKVSCSAVSSEPNGASDIVWSGGQLALRADRLGTGTGRTYTITCTATDASGNSASATTTVSVPHDQRTASR